MQLSSIKILKLKLNLKLEGKDSRVKQLQFDSAVHFRRNFSELCSKLHVCRVRQFKRNFEQGNSVE